MFHPDQYRQQVSDLSICRQVSIAASEIEKYTISIGYNIFFAMNSTASDAAAAINQQSAAALA